MHKAYIQRTYNMHTHHAYTCIAKRSGGLGGPSKPKHQFFQLSIANQDWGLLGECYQLSPKTISRYQAAKDYS